MANRFIGDASFEADGQTYTLRLDFNAMCELEDATGENAMQIVEQYEHGTINARNIRALFWAMLQEHHPQLTLKDAGGLLSIDPDAIGRALAAASPDASEVEKDPKPGNRKSRGKAA